MNGRSFVTSTTGIIAIVAALGGALDAYFDGDPKTMPNWGVVGSGIASGVGLIFALDSRVFKTSTGNTEIFAKEPEKK